MRENWSLYIITWEEERDRNLQGGKGQTQRCSFCNGVGHGCHPARVTRESLSAGAIFLNQ